GGWYITPDRAKVVGQSDPVYSDPPVLVSKKPVSKIEDLKGKTIGTTQGYLWVSDLQKYAGDNAKLFESPDAVFADLVNGRIDAGLMAVNEASYRMRKQPDSGLKSEIMEPSPAIDASQRPPVTNFPFKKGNTKLGEALNKQIANLRDSGKLAKILKQHGIDASAANPKSG
ncbi:MAG: substrate-binding periplasmic protein, partial [Micromonosporaceae bacterium]